MYQYNRERTSKCVLYKEVVLFTSIREKGPPQSVSFIRSVSQLYINVLAGVRGFLVMLPAWSN